MQRIDEFTVSGNLVFDDVKERIRFWLKTGIGSKYLFKPVTDEELSITRTEHDIRICALPLLVAPVASVLLIASIEVVSISVQTALLVIYVLMAGMIASFLVALAYYFMKPQEATFELSISHDAPITITVEGEGEILRARGDYESLKRTILRTDFGQLPEPDAW